MCLGLWAVSSGEDSSSLVKHIHAQHAKRAAGVFMKLQSPSLLLPISLCHSHLPSLAPFLPPYISLSALTAAVHGLCFSLCRLSLKPNTGTRSHLPGMAQMPTAVPGPRSHKTEVGPEVRMEGGAVAPGQEVTTPLW